MELKLRGKEKEKEKVTKRGKVFLSQKQTQSLKMCLQLVEEEVVEEPFCASEELRQEQPAQPLLFQLRVCAGICAGLVARGPPRALPAVQCNL